MPIPNEYREVVVGLQRATAEGRAAWTKQNAMYKVAFPAFNVVLWEGTDEETNRDFVALGIEKSDRIVDSFYLEKQDDDFDQLLALQQSAHRLATGVTEDLAQLKKMLESGKRLGRPA